MTPEEKQRRSDAMKAAHARRKAAKELAAISKIAGIPAVEARSVIEGIYGEKMEDILTPPAKPKLDVAAALAAPLTPTVSDTAPISMDEQRAIIPKVFSDSMQHIGVLKDGRRVAICEGVRMELLKPTMTSHTVTNPAQRLWNLPGSPAEVNTKGPKE